MKIQGNLKLIIPIGIALVGAGIGVYIWRKKKSITVAESGETPKSAPATTPAAKTTAPVTAPKTTTPAAKTVTPSATVTPTVTPVVTPPVSTKTTTATQTVAPVKTTSTPAPTPAPTPTPVATTLPTGTFKFTRVDKESDAKPFAKFTLEKATPGFVVGGKIKVTSPDYNGTATITYIYQNLVLFTNMPYTKGSTGTFVKV